MNTDSLLTDSLKASARIAASLYQPFVFLPIRATDAPIRMLEATNATAAVVPSTPLSSFNPAVWWIRRTA
jgi:hypothetical protein